MFYSLKEIASSALRRVRVASTVVASVAYDEGSSVLEVEFHNGDRYRYRMVPRTVFEAFLAAGSKGQFLREEILNHYPFERTRGSILP